MIGVVFVFIVSVVFPSAALAQELQQGQVCEKKIAFESGHYCGESPERAKYTLTNVGIHEIVVGPNSQCGEIFQNQGEYQPVKQAQTYVLDKGQQLFIDRVDEVLSSRTLTLQITTVEPCADCTPDPTMGGCSCEVDSRKDPKCPTIAGSLHNYCSRGPIPVCVQVWQESCPSDNAVYTCTDDLGIVSCNRCTE